MAKTSAADIKKKAITDLANATNYILIAIEGDKINRHQLITRPDYGLAALRTLKESEANILFPPQASDAVKK